MFYNIFADINVSSYINIQNIWKNPLTCFGGATIFTELEELC